MSTVVIVAMGLLVAAGFVIVVMNRQSQAVVTAAVPVVFGALSAMALVFAFNRPEPIRLTFPTAFYWQKSDKLGVVIPYRSFSWNALSWVEALKQVDPRLLDEPSDKAEGEELYHDLLQKALVDWIASRHFGTWRVQSIRASTGLGSTEEFGPMPDANQFASTIIDKEALKTVFAKNRFRDFNTAFGKIALPPKMTLTVEQETDKTLRRRMTFKNRYCTLRIITRWQGGGVGLGGYGRLIGMTAETAQEKYFNSEFIVEIVATFTPYLVGHPSMAAHREWAQNVIDGLRFAFDEERIWREAADTFMLMQHTKTTYPSVDVGPVHWTGPLPDGLTPKPAAAK